MQLKLGCRICLILSIEVWRVHFAGGLPGSWENLTSLIYLRLAQNNLVSGARTIYSVYMNELI